MYRLHTVGPTRGMRVVWTLAELGVEYEEKKVDFQAGTTRTPEYLKLNPMGKVPVLEDGEFSIFESVAICQYLAEKHPKAKLIPEPGTTQSGRYHQMNYFAVNELENNLWTREKHIWRYPEHQRSPDALTAATEEVSQALDGLDQLLDGAYVLGDQFSLADIVLGYPLRWAKGRDLLDADRPAGQYLERLISRPLFPHHLYNK